MPNWVQDYDYWGKIGDADVDVEAGHIYPKDFREISPVNFVL